jgi:hypothetical protein
VASHQELVEAVHDAKAIVDAAIPDDILAACPEDRIALRTAAFKMVLRELLDYEFDS